MSNLISEFFLSSILRQAHRYSRSSPPGDQVAELASNLSPESYPDSSNGHVASDAVNSLDPGIIHGPLTSSPVEEDGGLDTELEALQADRQTSLPAAYGSSSLVPLRLASLRSNLDDIDNDISDNPLFGTPDGLRRNSGANTSPAQMSPAEGPSRRSTGNASLYGPGSRRGNSSLPADDGMGAMRQAIISIQAKDVSTEEKARMMHQLLARNHHGTQRSALAKPYAQEYLQLDTATSQELPGGPATLSSFLWQMNGDEDDSPSVKHRTLNLSPEDLERTYAPIPPPEPDEDGDIVVPDITGDEPQVLGCQHYQRNVKLQCSTCHRWYTCRFCHDEVEDHLLIRNATKNMLCMLCGCAQPAGESCAECGESASWYYCDVCKLWDNDPNKSIYHCNDCGICRKGRGLGKDFFHCKVTSHRYPSSDLSS